MAARRSAVALVVRIAIADWGLLAGGQHVQELHALPPVAIACVPSLVRELGHSSPRTAARAGVNDKPSLAVESDLHGVVAPLLIRGLGT